MNCPIVCICCSLAYGLEEEDPTTMVHRNHVDVDEDDDDLLLGSGTQNASAATSAAKPIAVAQDDASPAAAAPSRKRTHEESTPSPSNYLNRQEGEAGTIRFQRKGGDGLQKMALLAFGAPSVARNLNEHNLQPSRSAAATSAAASTPVVSVAVVNNVASDDTPKDAKLRRVETTPATAAPAQLPTTVPTMQSQSQDVTAPQPMDIEGPEASPLEKQPTAPTPVVEAPKLKLAAPSKPTVVKSAPSSGKGKKAAAPPPKGQPKLDAFFSKMAFKPKEPTA